MPYFSLFHQYSAAPRLVALAAVLLACCSPATRAAEADPPGADWHRLVMLAESRNVDLQVMIGESDAAVARSDYAGALDDPMLEIEMMGIDGNHPQLLPSRVGETRYRFTQSLPWLGKRALERKVAAAEAGAAHGRVELGRWQLRAMLREAYSRRFVAERSIAIQNEMLGLLRQLEELAAVRYRNGSAVMQDLIRAQTEQTRLRTDILALERDLDRAGFSLNRLLARPPQAALEPASGPPPLPQQSLDDAALLLRASQASPLLAVREAESEASAASSRRVRRERFPDLRLGVAPLQMGDRVDSWQLMLEFNLPIRLSRRDAAEREAAAMLRASRMREEADRHAVLQQLGAAVAEFNAALEQQRLIAERLLPQSELAFETARAGYESARVDFDTLIEAERQILSARIEILMRQLDQQMAVAAIESTLGEEL